MPRNTRLRGNRAARAMMETGSGGDLLALTLVADRPPLLSRCRRRACPASFLQRIQEQGSRAIRTKRGTSFLQCGLWYELAACGFGMEDSALQLVFRPAPTLMSGRLKAA